MPTENAEEPPLVLSFHSNVGKHVSLGNGIENSIGQDVLLLTSRVFTLGVRFCTCLTEAFWDLIP